MNIEGMTDQEKSVLLDRARGHSFTFYDLYDPANMALAWRVLNWRFGKARAYKTIVVEFDKWWDSCVIWDKSPAAAQRAWLDKILELAIEAGIVELPASP